MTKIAQSFEGFPVKAGTSGIWEIDKFEVSEKEARRFNLGETIRGTNRHIAPGFYWRLTCSGRGTIMSNTPAELRDHAAFIDAAHGDVLINGLGLGACLYLILKKPEVKSVTVIEISQDVIDLVGKYFTDPRVTIICADALKWRPQKSVRYDCVWHDIWDAICGDNYPTMNTLQRVYGYKSDWQSSWVKKRVKELYKEDLKESR
mgnify:CR=1 FL=1